MVDDLFGKGHPALELEKDFQERVCHYARLKKWMVYCVPDSRRASLAGWPDLTMVRNGIIIFAELKREKGKLSESQKVVLSELEKIRCAKTFVWRPSQWDEITMALA